MAHNNEKLTTEQVIDALRKSRGIIAAAARALAVHRDTVQNYIDRYPTVRRAYEEQRETLVDVAEGKLTQAVDAGEQWAISLVLKTLGRNRGYVERQENENRESGEVTIKVVYADHQADAPETT